MPSTLSVRLVSPEKEVFRGEAASVVAPAWDGMLGILPGHAAFITLLGHGNLAVLTALVEYAGDGPPEVLPPEADFHPDDLAREAETEKRRGLIL
jgi:hypothetical protein